MMKQKTNYRHIEIHIMNKIIFVLLLIASTFSSYGQKNLNKENIASNYRPDDSYVHPSYKIYHEQDSVSTVIYEINLSELKYVVNSDSSKYIARAKIEYQLYMNYKAKDLIDSGHIYIEDDQNYGKDISTLGSFFINAKMGYSYVVRLTLTDLNNGNTNVRFVDIDKLDKESRQNYFLKASDDLPLIVDYVNRNDGYQLVHRDTTIKIAWVKYFRPNLKPARPPMSGGMPNKRIVRSDTIYRIHFNKGVSEVLHFKKQGYYHIMLDSLAQKGFTVYQFTSNYPYIYSPMQMVMPLRYLTTQSEFKKILNSKDQKKAVEEFWIEISGNKDRARRMISLYYNRVQQANSLFYSDREGWMTDRGMIYIIFGPPDMVYRDNQMETWVYGYQKNFKSLNFDFYKTDNPFTNEDFLLNRTPIYNTPWNNSLEIWRR